LSCLKGLTPAAIPTPLLALLGKLPPALPWAAAVTTWQTLQDLWMRRSSDDLALMLMLAVNDCVITVPSTQVWSFPGTAPDMPNASRTVLLERYNTFKACSAGHLMPSEVLVRGNDSQFLRVP
jgi:hypothetical protein